MRIVQFRRRDAGPASLSMVAGTLTAMIAGSILAILAPHAAIAKTPEACAALQAKYPSLKGKTLVNGVNPHTPGYEALDPKDPSKYVGFDIDLGEAIGDCLGFKLSYKPVTFAALLTTLEAARPISSSPISTPPSSAPRRLTSSPISRSTTASRSPRAIRRRSTASTSRSAARPRPRTRASSKCPSFRRSRKNARRPASRRPAFSSTTTTRRSCQDAPTLMSMT